MTNNAGVSVADMPRPPSNAVQIAIRVPAEWVDKAKALATTLSRAGVAVTQTDAFRAAMARGFEEFDRDAQRFDNKIARAQRVIDVSGAKIKILRSDRKTQQVTFRAPNGEHTVDVVDLEGNIAAQAGNIAGIDPDNGEPVLRGSKRDKELRRLHPMAWDK